MNPRYERWRWVTFGITWLIYASFYLTRQAFAVAKDPLQHDPNVALSRSDLGLMDVAYSITYMLGLFIFGAAGDRFGPRRILLAGMMLSIIAATACGFSTAFWAFLIFSVLQGVAQSTGWTNVNKTMAAWFSLKERGRVLGWWCTNYPFGASVALVLAGAMITWFSANPKEPYWPAAFFGSSVVLGGVMILAWLFLRNRPEDVGLPSIETYHGEKESLIDDEEADAPVAEGSWKVIREVMASPTIWMLAAAYLSIKLVRYSFYFWGPKYAAESLGTNPYVSAMTVAVFPIGGMVGVVGAGYISDKLFQSRRAPWAVISLVILALLMVVGLRPIDNIWVMGTFFFLAGVFLFGPDSMTSATASVDFGTKRGAGTATGMVNGFGSIGQIIAGYLPGVITSENNWTPLFIVFQVGLFASAVVLLPLWNRKPPQR